jgi:hypothetical protein
MDSQRNNLKKVGVLGLLNIKLFRTFHIAQTMAQTSTLICKTSFLGMSFNQLPNKFVTFLGGARLKFIWIMRHITLEKGHSKKRCCIVSSL